MKNPYEAPVLVEMAFADVTDLTASGRGISKIACKTWCR